ncbi:MAG: EAL domain-containing protein [Iodobacter sp.]
MIAANGLFILFIAGCLWLKSNDEATQLAETSAARTLHLIEKTLQNADMKLQQTASLLGQPCQAISGKLQKVTAVNPYFRMIYISDFNKSNIYCASSPNEQIDANFSVRKLLQGKNPDQPHLFWTPTSRITQRPSIVLYRPQKNGQAIIGTLEGQYFSDMLILRTGKNINRYEIDIHPLSMVNSNGKITFEPSQPNNPTNILAKSDLYPLFISASYSNTLLIAQAKANALWAGLLILMFYIGSHYLCWYVFGSKRYFIQQVQKAIQNKQFEPFYQPIVNTAGIASGAEVLIRWRHPAKGLIFPDQFIAAADQLNLLTPIMQSLFIQITEDTSQNLLPANCRLGINLSARQLEDPLMLGSVFNLNAHFKSKGYGLIVEITEEGIIKNQHHAKLVMDQMNASGIMVAIDDFGMGHSSLSYLRHFPFGYLKIDKSFVDGLPGNQKDIVIIKSIITLARELKLEIVAEGVETEAQAGYLRTMQIDYFQGYLFSKPLPLNNWLDFIKSNQQAAIMQ